MWEVRQSIKNDELCLFVCFKIFLESKEGSWIQGFSLFLSQHKRQKREGALAKLFMTTTLAAWVYAP